MPLNLTLQIMSCRKGEYCSNKCISTFLHDYILENGIFPSGMPHQCLDWPLQWLHPMEMYYNMACHNSPCDLALVVAKPISSNQSFKDPFQLLLLSSQLDSNNNQI